MKWLDYNCICQVFESEWRGLNMIPMMINIHSFPPFCLRFTMNSLNFCGASSGVGGVGAYPLHGVNSMLFDLHHQMAEQYHVYSAAAPTVHTLSVAERLAGGFTHFIDHWYLILPGNYFSVSFYLWCKVVLISFIHFFFTLSSDALTTNRWSCWGRPILLSCEVIVHLIIW